MNQRRTLRSNPKTRAIIDRCMEIVPIESLEAFVGLRMKYYFDDGYVVMSKTIATITFDYAYGLSKENLVLRVCPLYYGSIYDVLVSLVFSGQFDDLTIDKRKQEFDICTVLLTESIVGEEVHEINYMSVLQAYQKKDWRLLID